MLPRLGGPALSLLLPSLLLLLLLGAGGCGPGVRAEVLFRCPPCTPERLAACGPPPDGPCAELVREPGCGCCSVCARLEGEACGVYTPRCAQMLRCYPQSRLRAAPESAGLRRGYLCKESRGRHPTAGCR